MLNDKQDIVKDYHNTEDELDDVNFDVQAKNGFKAHLAERK